MTTVTAGRCSAISVPLLAWNSADPVDDPERRRHQRIAEMEGNRNHSWIGPFATAFWGSPCGVN
jgi:endonuclease I